MNPAHQADSPDSPEATGAPAAEPGVALESAGTQLSNRRRERSLEVADVAGRLKFAPRQIEALEADDYARLPGATFVRGMIRSYAKLLDCNAQPMLDAFEARQAPAVPASDPTPLSVPFPDGRTPSTRIYVVLCLVLAVLVGSVIYESQFGLPAILQPQPETPSVGQPLSESSPANAGDSKAAVIASEPEPTVVPEPQSPVPAETSATGSIPAMPVAVASATPVEQSAGTPVAASVSQASATAGGERLLLEFAQESWVEVRDRTGKVLALGLNAPGNSRVVEGRAPYAVVIGNASHVRVTYKGTAFDLKPFIKEDVARFSLN